MSSLLAFHAHPDDESVSTGVTLAKYADEGHRVVVATATDGSAVDHAASQETFDVQSIRSAFESMSSPSKHSEGDSDEVSIKSLIEQYETTAEAKQENNVKRNGSNLKRNESKSK